MGRIRIAIVTMAPMEGSIIPELINGYADVELVGSFATRADAEMALPEMVPDLVLIGLYEGETDRIADKLLGLVPSSKVIAFSDIAQMWV